MQNAKYEPKNKMQKFRRTYQLMTYDEIKRNIFFYGDFDD